MLTLAYKIAEKNPSAKVQMEEILGLKDGHDSLLPLSNRSLEDQFSILLINSPTTANHDVPDLIIIDGLDECASQKGIYLLIKWIRRNNPPFRFLFTSRPEPEIRDCFMGDVQTFSLTESEADIRKYFVKQLEEVWAKHRRIEGDGSLKEPSESDINRLVEKSEGIFIYAATAVRYIDGEGPPQDRLESVLKLHNGLDNLYDQVIREARKWDYFDIVMGSILYLRYPLNIDDLSSTLIALDDRLSSFNIRIALRRCHSVLVIENDTPIESYHASLRDFLTDHSRSGTLSHTPATCHGRLMLACLKVITKAFDNGTNAPKYALISWCYHAWHFLSTGGDAEGLEQVKDETQALVKKIKLNWVKMWMIEASGLAGVLYLKVKLHPTKVRDDM